MTRQFSVKQHIVSIFIDSYVILLSVESHVFFNYRYIVYVKCNLTDRSCISWNRHAKYKFLTFQRSCAE